MFAYLSYILACTEEEKQRLAFKLGRADRESVTKDSSEIGSIYRNIEFLKSLDINVFLRREIKSFSLS